MIQNVKRQLFLQLLLKSYSPAMADQLWQKLPIKGQEISNEVVLCPLNEPLNSNLDFLKKIHYTWIAAYISTLPENFQKSAATAFPEFEKIMQKLEVGGERAETVDPYIHHLLIEKIGLKERLPICFLEKSPFDELLKWNRSKLLSLIDLLPLADAGKEIKQIVDRNKLMLIYSALNEEQKEYIKHCMMTKHVSCDIKLNLRNWQGPKEKLKVYLHRLGLEMFAKGLAGQSEDFLFYLSHFLDAGRGKSLVSIAYSAKVEEKKELYFKNLTQAIKFINAHEKS